MDLSAIGSAVLVAREGRRLDAYRDSVGIWTIGVGHTSAAGPPVVTPGLRLTAQECDAVFARDVGRFVRTVRAAVPPGLPDHAFDALVSLCFNIGEGAFRRSTVVRRLTAGDREGAAQAILLWNRPSVLIPRRRAEYDQFRTPYDTALPRARSTDPTPILRPTGTAPAPPAAAANHATSRATLPAGIPSLPAGVPGLPAGVPGLPAGVPGLPAGIPGLPAGIPGLPAAWDRRPLPRPRSAPASPQRPAAPVPTGVWHRLRDFLRARFRASA